jgi:hypothetical protein
MEIMLKDQNITINENWYFYPEQLNKRYTTQHFDISAPLTRGTVIIALEALVTTVMYKMSGSILPTVVLGGFLGSIPFSSSKEITINNGHPTTEGKILIDDVHFTLDYAAQSIYNWLSGCDLAC